MNNSTSFVKLVRPTSPEQQDLIDFLLNRPGVWSLFTLISLRARRRPGIDPKTGIVLKVGEALR